MMFSLKALAAMAVGAVVVSAAYAMLVSEKHGGGFSYTAEFDDDNGAHFILNGDRGDFILRDDGRTLKARWRGDFHLDETGDAIGEIGKSLEIEISDDGAKKSAEFSRDDDVIKTAYYRDGEEQPAGEETDEAIKELVLKFLRASGFKSDERVAAILKQGGSAAVLSEMDRLEGGHAKKQYTESLTEQTDLAPQQILDLIGKLDDIDSDHDLSSALEAILDNEAVTVTTAPAILTAAQGLESDHSLRTLIEAIAERPLDEDSFTLLIGLYARIDSDHDMRLAAEALMENDDVAPTQIAQLLAVAAKHLESDHEMRVTLVEAAPFIAGAGALADAWFDAYATLESDHDQRLALEAVADDADADSDLRTAYRAAAASIESGHEREQALDALGDDADD